MASEDFDNKLIKSARHHWFPNSLMGVWGDDDGWINQKEPTGKITRFKKNAKSIGSIHNGHRLISSGPWASTLESFFKSFDDFFPKATEYLGCIVSNLPATPILNLNQSTPPIFVDDPYWKKTLECVASLILRSPSFRQQQKNIAESFGFYGPEITDNHHIIAANLHQIRNGVFDEVMQSRQFFILYSENIEFIFGDGIYSNVNGLGGGCLSKSIVPFTPNIAFVHHLPSSWHHSGCFLIKLRPIDVDSINYGTQVYSKNFLFYRNDEPKISNDFKNREHRMFQHHKMDFMELLSNLKNGARTAWNVL